jgi:hypothetical protein
VPEKVEKFRNTKPLEIWAADQTYKDHDKIGKNVNKEDVKCLHLRQACNSIPSTLKLLSASLCTSEFYTQTAAEWTFMISRNGEF